MKLILHADVDSLGRLGDIVKVKPGYGRNFLIPQGLAAPASEANLKQFELAKKKLAAKADSVRAAAQDLADKLAAAIVTLEVRVGEGDKLYGSVTSANIADALEALGIAMDRRKINLPDPIRSLGEHKVEARLHPDVHAEINVHVVKHGQAEEEPQPVEQPEPEATA